MLKKSITIVTLLFTAFILTLGFIQLNDDPNSDRAPIVRSNNGGIMADTVTPINFPYPVVFNFNYAGIGGVNAGSVGAMWFGGKYYLNAWNSTKVHRYNDDGPGGGPGTLADSLTYVGSCRDLATDGTFLYAGPASTVLYRFDPATMTTLKTFTLTGGSTRAVAWDPNRKGFWNCNFAGNLFFHDTNGVLKQQLTAGASISGKYGMGFDSLSVPDSAFLWVWSQDFSIPTDTTNKLHKININTGAVSAIYSFNIAGLGIAGGAEVVVKGNQVLLLLNYQNYAVIGYKLKELGPVVPTGTWTEQTSGLATTLYSVSAVDDNVAWVCGAAGKVLRTTNKGVNWVNVSGNLPAAVAMYNIFGWDANTAIVTGSSTSSFIYKTTNGGTNWTTVNTLAGGFDDNLWMTSANNAYCIGDAVGGNWNLLKSTNGGDNWTTWYTMPTTNTNGTYNNAACFLGNQVWWSPVGESKMKYSSDMGANWVDQTLPIASITATWFNSSTLGMAGGASASAGLLKTTNSGTNWTTITSPYPTSSITGIVGVANTWWVSQQGTGISVSTNDGANWTTAYTASAGSFYHMTKSRSGATIWAIRSNGGISRYGQPITGISTIGNEVPANYSVSQNYPNPFNPTTKINFALPKSGLVTMKVYDVLGKEVATLVNEVKNAGSYSVDFDGAKLSSGMYFYKISVNGFSEVKKMMLIK